MGFIMFLLQNSAFQSFMGWILMIAFAGIILYMIFSMFYITANDIAESEAQEELDEYKSELRNELNEYKRSLRKELNEYKSNIVVDTDIEFQIIQGKGYNV